MNNSRLTDDSFPGPIFDPGLGWGGHVKQFVRTHRYDVVLPVIVAVALVVFTHHFLQPQSTQIDTIVSPVATTDPTLASTLSIVVRPLEDYTHVARRLVAQYLPSHPEISLNKGEKLYMETIISQKIRNQSIEAGSTIKVSKADLETILYGAMALTPSQHQKWNAYANNVDIP